MDKRLKKLQKLARVMDGGDIALLKEIDTLEEETNAKLADLQAQIPPIEEVIERVKDGEKGERGERGESIKGDPGYTPIKGIDYVDGKDGRTPIFIGSKQPVNPQKGDLWYQD